MTFFQLLNSLTLAQAKEWEATPEKLIYVDDEILAPNNFKLTDKKLDAVEDCFEALLAGGK